MESSYDIVESSRYIPCDRSHMRTTEIDLYSSIVMAKKKTLKSVPLMLERNTFVCIVFERWVTKASNICVWRYFYTLDIMLTSIFTNHI